MKILSPLNLAIGTFALLAFSGFDTAENSPMRFVKDIRLKLRDATKLDSKAVDLGIAIGVYFLARKYL